jgi:hypothetical protein
MGISNIASNLRPGICTSSTRPTTPYEGQVVYETDTDQTLVWNGSAWVLLSTGTANPPGLELITACTASFTGGTAGSVSNGVVTIGTSNTAIDVISAFSSSYTNYKVIISGVDASSNAEGLRFNFGTTTPADGYYGNLSYLLFSNVTGTVASNNVGYLTIGLVGISDNSNTSFDVYQPNASKIASLSGTFAGAAYCGFFGGEQNSTTARTGFRITVSAGSLTGGTIRVYGYRN